MKWKSIQDEKPPFKQNQLFLVSNGREYSLSYYCLDLGGDSLPHFFPLEKHKTLENITHWMQIIEFKDFDSKWLQKQINLNVKKEKDKIPFCNCGKRSCVSLIREGKKTKYKCWKCYSK